MKKTMSIIALFAVVAISLSAHTERIFEAAEGYYAPDFSLTRGDSVAISLADMHGRYTLVCFWSSEEPQTRIAANEYAAFARNADATRFSLVSVNLDTSGSLFREIVRRDRLDEATQCHVDGPEARRLVDAYNMRHGLSSFLLDTDGRVVAVNPTRATLAAKIKR